MEVVKMFVEAFPETFDGKKVKVQAFKTGKWVHPQYGELEITKDDLNTTVKNFENTKRALVVDYDHGTDLGINPEEKKAAGWIRELEIKDLEDGETELWATFDATDKAFEYIQNGEFRLFSPTWNPNYENKESGKPQGMTLLRGALTNSPFIDGMHPAVAMSERAVKVMKEGIKLRGTNIVVKIENPVVKSNETPDIDHEEKPVKNDEGAPAKGQDDRKPEQNTEVVFVLCSEREEMLLNQARRAAVALTKS